jgi:predicted histone-like DNA-binding protein
MITFKIYQNQNKVIPGAYLKWYARPVVEETVDMEGLADHMANHNSPYSKGVLVGILTDMVACIKEQLLDGKNVRIDDLAIFSVGISSKGAESKEEFTVTNNVTNVRLRARATGELSTSQLNLDAVLKHASLDKTSTDDGEDDGGTTGSGTGSTSNGSQNSSGSSSNSSGSNSSGSNKDDVDRPGDDGIL